MEKGLRMTTITAKVIADTKHKGNRLTTMELRYPRIILAELNTHRMFSRNTSSSRAIPVERLIENVEHDPYIPLSWGQNARTMWSDGEIDDNMKGLAYKIWMDTMSNAVENARQMADIGIHKQFVNRILEPWSHVSTIVSSTEWDNFFNQRISQFAQPEMRLLAEKMKEAIDSSTPREITSTAGDRNYWSPESWHLPYITKNEIENVSSLSLFKVSVARCARVSYKSHVTGKVSTVDEDVELFNRLFNNGHWSPFEHIARPSKFDNTNFRGFVQFRKILESQKNGVILGEEYDGIA